MILDLLPAGNPLKQTSGHAVSWRRNNAGLLVHSISTPGNVDSYVEGMGKCTWRVWQWVVSG